MSDFAEHNLFEMYAANGMQPGLWLRRTTWDSTCALVVEVGEFSHLMKLASPKFRDDDPLWETDLSGAPTTPDQLRSALRVHVDAHRRLLSKNAALQAHQSRDLSR